MLCGPMPDNRISAATSIHEALSSLERLYFRVVVAVAAAAAIAAAVVVVSNESMCVRNFEAICRFVAVRLAPPRVHVAEFRE